MSAVKWPTPSMSFRCEMVGSGLLAAKAAVLTTETAMRAGLPMAAGLIHA
jgi:hypothetical protein